MAGTEYQRGSMDISEHREMWEIFISITKWSSAGIILVLALMAIFLT